MSATAAARLAADEQPFWLNAFLRRAVRSTDAALGDSRHRPVSTYGQGVGYSTQGYAVTRVTPAKTCAAGGRNVALRYLMFGRNEERFPLPSVKPPG